MLDRLWPSPMIRLNEAIAISLCGGSRCWFATFGLRCPNQIAAACVLGGIARLRRPIIDLDAQPKPSRTGPTLRHWRQMLLSES